MNNNVIADLAIALGMDQYVRYLPAEGLAHKGKAYKHMLADVFEGNSSTATTARVLCQSSN